MTIAWLSLLPLSFTSVDFLLNTEHWLSNIIHYEHIMCLAGCVEGADTEQMHCVPLQSQYPETAGRVFLCCALWAALLVSQAGPGRRASPGIHNLLFVANTTTTW